MLRNTTKSVAAIRDTLGYENPEAFIRAFKKELHTTPANISVSTMTHYLKPETIPDKFTDRYLQTDLPESALKNNTPDKFRIPSG